MAIVKSAAITSVSLTGRRYMAPFILIASPFFLWAFGVNLNDISIPNFKKAFQTDAG
jgi:fucose permease